MIALEAAALGLPLVLTTRVGAVGPSSIARPGKNTIVHEPGDVPALASSLAQLADDPALRRAMSDASLEFSKDHDGLMSVENTVRAVQYCLSTKRHASADNKAS